MKTMLSPNEIQSKNVFNCFRVYPEDYPCVKRFTAIRTYTDNIVNAPTSHTLIWTYQVHGPDAQTLQSFLITIFRLHKTNKRSALQCTQA